MIVNPYFNVDLKKNNFLVKIAANENIEIRFFKKIFKLYGYQFFLNTKDYVLENYLQENHFHIKE